MNDIPTRQDQERHLRELAATRHLYGQAKDLAALQFTIATIVSAGLAILETVDPTAKLWTAFVGLVLALINEAVIEPIKASRRAAAATMQEAFDCAVLALPWSTLTAGEEPDREESLKSSEELENIGRLRDWYPSAVATVSPELGRLICQRSNSVWDSKQRRIYRNVVITVLVIVVLILASVGLGEHLTLADFVLTCLAPSFPFILWAIRERREQTEAADRADRLRIYTNDLWARAVRREVHGDELTRESRRLQDALYAHRKTSPMIFDWFYQLLRSRFEIQLHEGAADMIDEIERGRS